MNSLWDIINIPMGYVIRFCNFLGGNQYILALLIFAVFVEAILLPFGIKQQKNSIKQARLRPKEMAIRKKYAGRDDAPTKQKMTQEIQELYQKEGYNMMGGCLPLLIQFPIIIALYNIVLNPLHYICRLSNEAITNVVSIVSAITGKSYDAARNIDLLGDMKAIISEQGTGVFSGVEGFSDKIKDVSDLPNLSVFGGAINLAETPSFTAFNWLLLIPVLTFLAYFLSMKVTRKLSYQPITDDKAMGCSNKMMDIAMPLMSVFISFRVPAAIGVYWIFKCIVGMGKQAILKAAMPIPQFTEEDYKQAEKEMNVRAEKAPKASSGRVVRSLHHIDDEDFPDTAPAAKARREALEAQEAAQNTESGTDDKKRVIAAAPIKEDAPKPPQEKKSKRKERADEPAEEKDAGEKDTSENDTTSK